MYANSLDYKDIGRRIRSIREEAGIKQNKLAEIAGLTPAYLSHIENGNTKAALPTIVKIANALSVSVDYFLCDNLKYVKPIYEQKVADILEDCSSDEVKVFAEIICNIKEFLRKPDNNISDEK